VDRQAYLKGEIAAMQGKEEDPTQQQDAGA
jgi:hypothetical protein